jgi:DNA-binding transcriptional LysR family regulator
MEKNGLFSQRIRLRHLHTFVAVAQQGTLGRAAETLNLSQPALSKTLNELEQLTGTRFDRGRLGAQLTLVGEQFLTHAVKVLDALNTAGQALNRKDEHTSEIARWRPAYGCAGHSACRYWPVPQAAKAYDDSGRDHE